MRLLLLLLLLEMVRVVMLKMQVVHPAQNGRGRGAGLGEDVKVHGTSSISAVLERIFFKKTSSYRLVQYILPMY